jgi:hypothetical protein
MRPRAEVRSVIAGLHKEFVDGLGSLDQSLSQINSGVDVHNVGRNSIYQAMKNEGLEGQVLLFSADNRPKGTPIGLPIINTSIADRGVGEDYRIGVYLPVSADREIASDGVGLQSVVDRATETMHAQLKAKNEWVPMVDGLVVATNDQVDRWFEGGMFPKPSSDHSTRMTADDRAWIDGENQRHLPAYADALIDGVVKLAAQGLKPGDLASDGRLVSWIGRQTVVSVTSVTSVDHASVIDKVKERDGGRCGMPLMATFEQSGGHGGGVEVPVCDRNLVDYHPYVAPTYNRIVLGRPVGHANHILPRGAAINAGVNYAFLDQGPTSRILHDPEKLLMVLSHMNLSELTAVNSIKKDEDNVEQRLNTVIPLIDAAVNNLGNLIFMEENCHMGYHPDQRYMLNSIASFLYGINSGEIKVPLSGGDAIMAGFKKEIRAKLLSNQDISTRRRYDYGSAMALLKQGRMLVGLSRVPYWQHTLTRPQQEIARGRTRDYIREESDRVERKHLRRLDGIVNGYGAHIKELPEVVQIVDELYDELADLGRILHPKRKSIRKKSP